jgi:hypothetical protein
MKMLLLACLLALTAVSVIVTFETAVAGGADGGPSVADGCNSCGNG